MRLKIIFLATSITLAFSQCEEIIPKPPAGSGGSDGTGGTTIDDLVPVDGEYANCLNKLSDQTLDIVTWNIEQFSASNTSISRLTDLIETIDADLIGVQEITSISDFNNMVSTMPNWDAVFIDQNGLSTGYAYKTTELTQVGTLTTIYNNEQSAFPRAPIVAKFSHISGLQFTVINIHLKCCGGADNESRRRTASSLLQSYIDTNLPNEPVLVIGDYNDEIQEAPQLNVFQNFIDDSQYYRFADMGIATGSNDNFSYPSYNPPSHLDHILITDELFDTWYYTETLKLDDCYDSYDVNISDHRPVMARFNLFK